MYKRQVEKDHYSTGYNFKGRFISYFHQQRIINDLRKGKKNFSVAEIGPGAHFIPKYFGSEIKYQSIDIASDLKPDYIGSITSLTTIKGLKKSNLVCAFQVLEHIQYEDAEKALLEMAAKSHQYVFVSIPQVYLYISLWAKVSKLNPKSFTLRIPFPRKHQFDGQHYWELGAKGYSKKRFRKSIEKADLKIIEEFSDGLNPYHRFFVCEKK